MRRGAFSKEIYIILALSAFTTGLWAEELDTLRLTDDRYYGFETAQNFVINYAGATIETDPACGNHYLAVSYPAAATQDTYTIAQGDPEVEGAAFEVSSAYNRTTAYTVSAQIKMVSDSMPTYLKINFKDNYPPLPPDADMDHLWKYERGVTFYVETSSAIQMPNEWVEISQNRSGDQGVRADLVGATLQVQSCTEVWTHPQPCEFYMDDLALTLVTEAISLGVDAAAPPVTLVSTTAGAVVVKSGVDQPIRVYNLAGAVIASLSASAGETLTIPVGKGIYLVNHIKVVVK